MKEMTEGVMNRGQKRVAGDTGQDRSRLGNPTGGINDHVLDLVHRIDVGT